MCNDNLVMRLEPRLYPSGLPVPEYDVSSAITTTDPLPIGREPDLTSVSSNRVTCESLFPILSEIVRTVD